MAKPLKIYIGGDIYGAGNIGDDSILYGILKILNNKNYIFTIGTWKGVKLSNLPSKNIDFINALNSKEVKKTIKNSDIFLCGGGTMIGDELSLSFPLIYVAKLISLAKLYKKKVYLFSIGANKLKSEKAEKIVKKIYNLADIITLRDQESLEVCKNLGIPDKKLVVTADPAFLLRKQETKRTKELKNIILNKNKKIFGVNIANESWSHIKKYKKTIAEACNYIYKQYGYKPIFFCNEIRGGKFYDYEANKEAAKYLICDYELLDPVYYTPPEMIDIISSFKFTVGMRMHALIFSSIANVPFVAISRIDKVNNFMNLFGLEVSGNVNNLQLKQLTKDIEKTIRKTSNLKREFPKKISKLKKMVARNENIFKGLTIKKNPSVKFNFMSLKYVFCNSFGFPLRLIKKLTKKIL